MTAITIGNRQIVTIGKRLIALGQIAFIEAFDPAANPDFKPEKDFRGRIVLLNRDAVLTEDTPAAFAEAHQLHLFTEDDVAVNRAIVFKVEMFEPREGFTPSKPFKTRIKWSDTSGADQSKLLVTEPETVINEIVQAKVDRPAPAKVAAKRPPRGRKGSTRMDAFHS